MPGLKIWSGGLHLSFRLVPTSEQLRTFLAAENGTPWEEIHAALPYDTERARGGEAAPDARRYRDSKQLYETAGLVYQDDGRVWFTELGAALKRLQPRLSKANAVLIARHAALTLAACQLRNPTDAGSKYDPAVRVFPFRSIWTAMLELGLVIRSDELNRSIFRVADEASLAASIRAIRAVRQTGRIEDLGEETITGHGKNDRIIPWMSLASFGWTLIMDKRESPVDGYYHIRPEFVPILEGALATPPRHREFPSVKAYFEHLGEAACLPKDMR
jgi:hypothetical protein